MGRPKGSGGNSSGGGSSSGGEGKSKYRRWPEKHTDEYVEKREKNNAAVKKSREKARLKAAEMATKVAALRSENRQLEDRVGALEQELADLKEVFFTKATQGAAAAAVAAAAVAADRKS